jgi:hypothetical protein
MVDGKNQTAAEVSKMLLEATRVALFSGDFDAFAACFHLPHHMASAEDEKVLKTRDDLHDVFLSVTADLARRRITNLVRVCEVAEYSSATSIKATHMTHLMSGSQRVNSPYPSLSIIELIDGRWKVAASQYDVDKTTMVGRALDAQRAAPRQTPTQVRNVI